MGAHRLGMRALAAKLGIGAATLYYHVGSKEELLGLLGARLLDRFRLRLPDPSEWEGAMRQTASELRALFEASRGSAEAAMKEPRWGLPIIALHEESCRYLVRAGFTPEEAWLATRLIADFVEGFVVRREAHERAEVSDLTYAARLAGPTLRAAERRLGGEHHERRFAMGLDCIVRGLRARRLRVGSASSRP